MKKLFLLMSLLLTSCIPYLYYKDGCRYTSFTTSCDGGGFPSIAHYQNPNTIGYTNPEQRWNTAVNCGMNPISSKGGHVRFYSLDSYTGNNRVSLSERERKAKEFQQCMLNKGYIRIEQCGRMNSVTDKKLCNM